MPALPPAAGVIRVELHYSEGEDVNALNRHFMSFSPSPLPVGGPAAICSEVSTAWAAHLQSLFCTNTSLTTIKVVDLTSDTAPEGSIAGPGAGTGNVNFVTAGACMLINYQVPRRYRGGHPRTYLPGRSADEVQDAQTWTSAALSAVAAGYTAFLHEILTASYTGFALNQLVNVSYFQGYHNVTYPSGRVRSVPTLRGTPEIDTMLLGSINPKIASQRRRYLIRA